MYGNNNSKKMRKKIKSNTYIERYLMNELTSKIKLKNERKKRHMYHKNHGKEK
jgi:hypothetical protein